MTVGISQVIKRLHKKFEHDISLQHGLEQNNHALQLREILEGRGGGGALFVCHRPYETRIPAKGLLSRRGRQATNSPGCAHPQASCSAGLSRFESIPYEATTKHTRGNTTSTLSEHRATGTASQRGYARCLVYFCSKRSDIVVSNNALKDVGKHNSQIG